MSFRPAARQGHAIPAWAIRVFACLIALPGLTFPCATRAESIHVASWNVRAGNLETGAALLRQTGPELILLQGVRDRSMCLRLAKALQPATYHVLACSAFASATNSPGNQQVAILATERGYFSWSETWRATGEPRSRNGFTFAALQLGKRRLGFISLELDEAQRDEALATQLLELLSTVKHWEQNRVESILVGGAFGGAAKGGDAPTLPMVKRLEGADFIGAVPTVTPPERSSDTVTERLFVDSSAFPLSAEYLLVPRSAHPILLCEIELDPVNVAAARTARAEVRARAALATAAQLSARAKSETTASTTADPSGNRSPFLVQPWVAWTIASSAVAVAGLTLVWVIFMRKTTSDPHAIRLLRDTAETGAASGYTVVIAPQSITASAANSPPVGEVRRPGASLDSRAKPQAPSLEHESRPAPGETPLSQSDAWLREGLMQNLSQWLKQKLVRRLMADRAQLLEAQQAATMKALEVDDRLARIEKQIQESNRAYERRIEDLTRELLAAREESRELIRARIAQVKAEMESSAARLRAEAAVESQ